MIAATTYVDVIGVTMISDENCDFYDKVQWSSERAWCVCVWGGVFCLFCLFCHLK